MVDQRAGGFPITSAVLGVLIIGVIFKELKECRRNNQIDDQLREIIANTFGRIMNTIVEEGHDENTNVIYISDHDDWLGE